LKVSGLGAQTAIISSLKRGDGILVDRHVNLPTVNLLNKFAVNMEMEVNFADFNDFSSLENHLKPNLKLVWFETPSIPTMKVIDIKSIVDFFHEKSEAKIVVDNSTLSSYLQRPLELGVDIVIYSITKYVHGHSDVVMGSLAINDEKIHEKLKYHQGATGIIPSPFDW
jgi:cystathionine gamma-lyase